MSANNIFFRPGGAIFFGKGGWGEGRILPHAISWIRRWLCLYNSYYVDCHKSVQIHQTAPMQIDIAATPFGLGDMGGLAGLSNLGMGSANFMDLQQSLQKEVFLHAFCYNLPVI